MVGNKERNILMKMKKQQLIDALLTIIYEGKRTEEDSDFGLRVRSILRVDLNID